MLMPCSYPSLAGPNDGGSGTTSRCPAASEGSDPGPGRAGQGQPSPMGGRPELEASRVRPLVESPVGAAVVFDGAPQVGRPVGIGRLVGLLGLISGSAQIPVEQPRRDPVGQDRSHRGPAHPDLAPGMM